MPKDVFISYAGEDAPFTQELCERIEGHGIGCWMAPRDVEPGGNYGEAIISAIEAVRVVIVVISGHANGSAHVANEVVTAFTRVADPPDRSGHEKPRTFQFPLPARRPPDPSGHAPGTVAAVAAGRWRGGGGYVGCPEGTYSCR